MHLPHLLYPRLKAAALISTLAALTLLGACGGSRQDHAASLARARNTGPAPSQLALPAPSVLQSALGEAMAPRSASYTPQDLLAEAETFDTNAPSARVLADADGLSLQPDNNNPGGLGGKAYAVLNFNVHEYGGDSSLQLQYHSAPANPGEMHLALANWGANRWDWYAPDASGMVLLPDIAPYFLFNGLLSACVLMEGSSGCELDSLRIGSLPPAPLITATPPYGLLPLSVSFSAAASTDPDNAIAEYLFDPENDGSYVSNGLDPLLEQTYDVAGDYTVGLRVVDETGVYADTAVTVKPRDYEFHIAGNSNLQILSRILPLAEGRLALVGNSDELHSTGAVAFVEAGHSAVSAFTSTPNFYLSEFTDAALGADGSVYTCGSITLETGFLANALLQKWNPDGTLAWSHEFGEALDSERFLGIAISSDAVYLCGTREFNANGQTHPFVQRCDLDGNLIWNRSIDNSFAIVLNDILYLEPLELGDPSVHVTGVVYTGGTSAVYLTFMADGSVESSSRMDFGEAETGLRLAVTGGPTSPVVHVLGTSFNADNYSLFISRPGGTLGYIDLGGIVDLGDVIPRGNSAFIVATEEYNSETSLFEARLIKLDSSYNVLGALKLYTAEGSSFTDARVWSLGTGRLGLGGTLTGLPPEIEPNVPLASTGPATWNSTSPTVTPFDGLTQTAQTPNVVELAFEIDDFPSDQDFGFGETQNSPL